MIRLLALACLAVACGGAPAARRPTPPRAAPSPAPNEASTPSRAECDQLIAHALALGVADQRAQLPPDRAATEPQQAQIAAELRDRFGDDCLHLSRTTVRCALAAATSDALAACDAGQATRSSSTSNSSVAPGGITPPAPRSP